LLEIEYKDFAEQVDYLEKEKEKEHKQQYVVAAYTCWLQGSGGKRTFKEYLDSLGLSVEKRAPLTKTQKRAIATKGIMAAQKILKMRIKKKNK